MNLFMSNSRNNWLIHFSADDYWNSNTAVRHHICQALNEAGYKILWVNPIGFRMPSLAKRGTFRKILRKLISILKFMRKVSSGWFVFTPLQLPLFRTSYLSKLNQRILNVQISTCRILLRIHNSIVLYTTPTFASMIHCDRARRRIYYYSDQYTLYRELSDSERSWMERKDSDLQAASDTVICCSRNILDNVKKNVSADKLIYFPHRVDFVKFNGADRGNLPEDLMRIPSPRIGYYGTLTDSNDWDIIRYCAKLRPNYQFVFIGRKDIANAGVEHLPNVHFLGKKSYEVIQNYGAVFDVAIMFWIRRDWIKHSSPLKLKEYLALGVPVVSTRIEEVEKYYTDIVYSTETPEEFLEALDNAIAKDNSERIRKGLKRVSADTWNDIIPIIEGENK